MVTGTAQVASTAMSRRRSVTARGLCLLFMRLSRLSAPHRGFGTQR